MPQRARRLGITLLVILTTSAGEMAPALAGPIDADRVSIERTTREQLTFSTHDPSWTLPAPSPSDDGPGTIRVELFSPAEPFGATLTVPELGSPSVWRISRRSDRSVLAFRLRNPDAPNGAGDFSAALLHHTGKLRLKARRSPHHPGPRGRLPIDAVMPKSERGARGVTTRTSPEHVLGAADTHRRRCDGMHTAVATIAVLR